MSETWYFVWVLKISFLQSVKWGQMHKKKNTEQRLLKKHVCSRAIAKKYFCSFIFSLLVCLLLEIVVGWFKGVARRKFVGGSFICARLTLGLSRTFWYADSLLGVTLWLHCGFPFPLHGWRAKWRVAALFSTFQKAVFLWNMRAVSGSRCFWEGKTSVISKSSLALAQKVVVSLFALFVYVWVGVGVRRLFLFESYGWLFCFQKQGIWD